MRRNLTNLLTIKISKTTSRNLKLKNVNYKLEQAQEMSQTLSVQSTLIAYTVIPVQINLRKFQNQINTNHLRKVPKIINLISQKNLHKVSILFQLVICFLRNLKTKISLKWSQIKIDKIIKLRSSLLRKDIIIFMKDNVCLRKQHSITKMKMLINSFNQNPKKKPQKYKNNKKWYLSQLDNKSIIVSKKLSNSKNWILFSKTIK